MKLFNWTHKKSLTFGHFCLPLRQSIYSSEFFFAGCWFLSSVCVALWVRRFVLLCIYSRLFFGRLGSFKRIMNLHCGGTIDLHPTKMSKIAHKRDSLWKYFWNSKVFLIDAMHDITHARSNVQTLFTICSLCIWIISIVTTKHVCK